MDALTLMPKPNIRVSQHVRIGIIAHLKHPVREPFAGGLEMHTHILAEKFRSRGHRVTVFASTESSSTIGLEPICSQTSLNEVGDAEAHDVAFFREHHAYLSLMNRLRKSDFDVVHNNSLHYLPLITADTLAMPVVTTLHTPPFSWLESGIRIAGNRNMTLIAVSSAIQRQWSPICPVERVINNGVDLAQFEYRAMPDSDPYLVWYGRIVPEKGLHLAIEAARLVGLPLRFAGPISDSEYFKRMVRPRLGDDTTYEGHLDHSHLAQLIGGARAFLCTPCWEEPYGLVVAEAMACGVPVAAFARGALPDIIDRRSGRLAIPDDPVSLADAVRAALALSRAECRARAEEACDVESMIDGYELAYEQAVRSHSGQSVSG